jgi:DNA modification methylase
MKAMPDNSVDAIVTDPPYELGFMGKSWDASGIAFNIEVWQEALRVIKPGGHLIAFSGSRTYHRMAVAIEDAGFQIRDQIMWVYGSGFPKSHNISKGIDKQNGEVDRLIRFTLWMRTTGLKVKDVTKVLVDNNLIGENGTIAGHYFASKATSQPAIPTVAMWQVIRPLIAGVPEWVDELVDRIEAEREVVGKGFSTLINGTGTYAVTNGEAGEEWKPKDYNITAPATPAAQQWDGWGTALKPAHEPMVLARKPLEGTVANNVLTWGVGGLNIDGTRVGNEGGTKASETFANSESITAYGNGLNGNKKPVAIDAGRFPANFIHDGSDEVVGLFPDSKGMATQKSGANINVYGGNALNESSTTFPEIREGFNDSGSAARFFYCAKASKRDRNEGLEGFEAKVGAKQFNEGMEGKLRSDGSEIKPAIAHSNHHPTVKPTTLMQYLVRLVTPPGGIVLDPFMGSGSTGKACAYEGFDFIGIDQSAEYVAIAQARIDFALADKSDQLEL